MWAISLPILLFGIVIGWCVGTRFNKLNRELKRAKTTIEACYNSIDHYNTRDKTLDYPSKILVYSWLEQHILDYMKHK